MDTITIPVSNSHMRPSELLARASQIRAEALYRGGSMTMREAERKANAEPVSNLRRKFR